jgi:hypothetical protein
MKIKDLKEGQWFKIVNDDNEDITISFGKITSIWSMRAGNAWGIQFNDALETFTWGKDSDELPQGFEFIGEEVF